MKKKTIEVLTHYKPVGIIDGCRSTSFSQDKFSLLNKQDAIQRSASAIKIRTLRTQYDKLLVMDPPQEPKPGETAPLTLEPCSSVPALVHDAFARDDGEDSISLSVYNGPKEMAARKPRPLTT